MARSGASSGSSNALLDAAPEARVHKKNTVTSPCITGTLAPAIGRIASSSCSQGLHRCSVLKHEFSLARQEKKSCVKSHVSAVSADARNAWRRPTSQNVHRAKSMTLTQAMRSLAELPPCFAAVGEAASVPRHCRGSCNFRRWICSRDPRIRRSQEH